MPAPKNDDLEKVTMNLRRGDMDFLATVAAGVGLHKSQLARMIVSQKVDELRARETKMQDGLSINL